MRSDSTENYAKGAPVNECSIVEITNNKGEKVRKVQYKGKELIFDETDQWEVFKNSFDLIKTENFLVLGNRLYTAVESGDIGMTNAIVETIFNFPTFWVQVLSSCCNNTDTNGNNILHLMMMNKTTPAWIDILSDLLTKIFLAYKTTHTHNDATSNISVHLTDMSGNNTPVELNNTDTVRDLKDAYHRVTGAYVDKVLYDYDRSHILNDDWKLDKIRSPASQPPTSESPTSEPPTSESPTSEPLQLIVLLLDLNFVNQPNNIGQTPLHIAVKNMLNGIIEQMCDLPKIQLTSKNQDGNTPLHIAVYNIPYYTRQNDVSLYAQHMQTLKRLTTHDSIYITNSDKHTAFCIVVLVTTNFINNRYDAYKSNINQLRHHYNILVLFIIEKEYQLSEDKSDLLHHNIIQLYYLCQERLTNSMLFKRWVESNNIIKRRRNTI